VDTIKSLPEVHEVDEEGCVPFQALFYDVIHPLPFLKPACLCLILVSMAVSMSPRTLQNTLLGTDRRVIPRQLSQFLVLPFFGNFDNNTFRPVFRDGVAVPNVFE
jgi:hypothetical protein